MRANSPEIPSVSGNASTKRTFGLVRSGSEVPLVAGERFGRSARGSCANAEAHDSAPMARAPASASSIRWNMFLP